MVQAIEAKTDLLDAWAMAAASRARSQDAARKGLADVILNTPVSHGYADLLGGYTQMGGGYAKAEVGYRPLENLSLFASGGYEQQDGWGVQGGVRWQF